MFGTGIKPIQARVFRANPQETILIFSQRRDTVAAERDGGVGIMVVGDKTT
jgi:hypothetical protein